MKLYYRSVKDSEEKRREERDKVIELLRRMEHCLKQAVLEMRQGKRDLSGMCGELGVYARSLQDPQVALWMRGPASTRMIDDMAEYWNKAFDIEYIAMELPEDSLLREELLNQLEEAAGQCQATVRQLEAMR
jgi:hypothetical protein